MKRKKINTYLTLEARLFIEEKLNMGDISNQLNRDCTNIAREIIKNRTILLPTSFGGTSCCTHKDVCTNRHYDCDKNCNKFELEICDKLKASPHVCNACTNKKCRKAKFYYRAIEANSQYLKKLSESRNKLHYTELELKILNNDFYYLVINNKSIYHSLCVINSMGFNFNIKTIYRQIKNDRLRLKTSDLPRANKPITKTEVDKTYKRDIKGHTYEDYLKKKEEIPNIIEWQMDCVQGMQGKNEQVFLTIQIVKIKFLFIFILKAHTNEEVNQKTKTI